MKRQPAVIIVASLAGIFTMVGADASTTRAGQPESTPPPPPPADGQPADAMSNVPLGLIPVEREMLFRLDDDAFDHVTRARELYRKRQAWEAIGHLRRAGWIFGLIEHAARNQPPSDSTAQDADQRFEKLSQDCERHAVEGDRDFDRRLMEIHLAMANLMHDRAHAAWSDRRGREAGYCLRSAARHVDFAAAYVGSEMDRPLKALIQGARVSGGKIVGDTGWTFEDVEKGLQAIDAGLAWVNRQAEASAPKHVEQAVPPSPRPEGSR
ncbi:MAG: hypothetical protein WCK33_01330 [Phycisphaerae bacterium]|jgi:hypothetical protein